MGCACASQRLSGNEAWHEVELLGGLVRVGYRLVCKVVHFDPCCEKALHVLFRQLLDVANVVGDFYWGGRGWLGKTGGERGWLGHVGKGVVDEIKD